MTPDQLKSLRALCEAATPGPWKPDVWIETDGNEWRATGPGHDEHSHDEGSEPGCLDEQAAQRDAAFISAARQAVPALIEEVEKLRRDMASPLKLCIGQRDAALDREDALRAQLAAVTAARDEACDWAVGAGDKRRLYGLMPDDERRITALRKVGQ